MSPGRSPQPPGLEELAAFADGELRRRDARRVAAHLRAHPADADRVRTWLDLDAQLREAHAEAMGEPIPEVLRRVLVRREGGRARPRGAIGGALGLAASGVLAAAIALVAWLGVDGALAPEQADEAPSFVSAVVGAYHRAGKPGGGRIDARAARGTSPPSPAVASAPDLSSLGLHLEGARELRRDGHAFAEYVYRDAQGRHVALYESADAPLREGVLRIVERDGVRVVEWASGRRHLAMVADHTVAGLAGLAARVRRGMPGPALAGSAETAPATPSRGTHPRGGSPADAPILVPNTRGTAPTPGASRATAVPAAAGAHEM